MSTSGAPLPPSEIAPLDGQATADIDLSDILSLPELEDRARLCMPTMMYEYLASGAGDELSLRWSRESYDRIRLRPRVLRDVANVDTTMTLFGRTHSTPILLAPTAYHRALHAEGEIATARGAAGAGVTFVVSTATTTSLEDIAAASTAPLWFQLYVQPDKEITRELVQRAESAGCEALCLTVDTPNQGIRNRQVRSGFKLPAGVIAPYMTELNVAGGARPIADTRRGSVVTWKDVEWLQSIARVPVLLKGVLDSADAQTAVSIGASGIIVSNHGARNLDTVLATIDALPAIVNVVKDRIPVLVDGGIRRGTDIIKALASGAKAVLIGRPYCFGLAVAGAAGVERVVEILQTELEMGMQLMGRRTLQELDRSALLV